MIAQISFFLITQIILVYINGEIHDQAAAYVNKQARLLKWRGLKDTFLTERRPM